MTVKFLRNQLQWLSTFEFFKLEIENDVIKEFKSVLHIE